MAFVNEYIPEEDLITYDFATSSMRGGGGVVLMALGLLTGNEISGSGVFMLKVTTLNSMAGLLAKEPGISTGKGC